MCFGWRGRRPLGYILVPQRLSPLCLAPGVFARLACLSSPRSRRLPLLPPAPRCSRGPEEAGGCPGTLRSRHPGPHLARGDARGGAGAAPSAEAPRAGRGGAGAARREGRPGQSRAAPRPRRKGRGLAGAGRCRRPGSAGGSAAERGLRSWLRFSPQSPTGAGTAEGTRRFFPGRWRRGGSGPRRREGRSGGAASRRGPSRPCPAPCVPSRPFAAGPGHGPARLRVRGASGSPAGAARSAEAGPQQRGEDALGGADSRVPPALRG